MTEMRDRAQKALASYDLIGEGDWTPQDVWGYYCAKDVMALLDYLDTGPLVWPKGKS